MKSGKESVLLFVIASALLVMVFECFTGKAGSLEPYGAPGPTMVTLGQLSAQIQALSSPVKKVVRGVITFTKYQTAGIDDLSSPVDPNRCVVLLSDAVASNHDGTVEPQSWLARTGACLGSLTETQISVQTEMLATEQKVSYQIIEYK